MRPPDPPRDLGRAGKRAWRATIASLPQGARFTPKELEGVRLLAGQADTVASLERELAAEFSLSGARALSAARVACAKLLSEVQLEVAADAAPAVRSRRAQRAAQARWRAQKDLAETRRELTG